jgi:hypothetical protein
MTRFFFDFLSNGSKAPDTVGTVLPDLAAAKLEGAMAAAEWIKDHASEDGADLVLSVRDGKPGPLFIVNASIKIVPTT